MSAITIVILVFSVLGAADYIFGNKMGIGNEFQRAFSMFGSMALSTLGMIVIAPAIGVMLTPFCGVFYDWFGIDPSIIPVSLLANDMGGMTLAQSICVSKNMGDYNAFVISSMMGCVVSFTLPISLGMVKQTQHSDLLFGFLCGIATVPVGSFVAGLMCQLPIRALVMNLLPLLILSLMIGVALICVPQICMKCFGVFGMLMKILALIGLVCAIFTFLTHREISPHLDTFENAVFVCVNACVTLSGALPLMFVVSKLLNRPLNQLGSRLGITGISAVAFVGSLVTNVSTFGVMERMDKKGVVLNAAFAVSASFVFGSHLAFTMAFDDAYVLPMIVGKLVSGFCAVALALLLYKEAPAAGENKAV